MRGVLSVPGSFPTVTGARIRKARAEHLLRWCCLTGKVSGELAAGRSGCYQATGLKMPGGLVNDATGMLRQLMISAVVLGAGKRSRTALSLRVWYSSRLSSNDSSHLGQEASCQRTLGR